MALVLADRVKETTTTTGTGTLTLAGAATGFQSFSVIGNANTTYYAISSSGSSEWEVGLGTYTSSGTTLARTTILASSNAGSAVNLSAGTKDVFVTFPSSFAISPSLTNPTVTNYTETPYTANSSTAITLALTNGTVQIITLTGNATVTMPTATSGKSFILYLKQDGTGSRTVTWSTVKWPGGTAPTITSTASKQDIFSFFADGTNWYGATVGQNYTP